MKFNRVHIVTIISFVFLNLQGQTLTNLENKVDRYVQPYLDMNAWSGVVSIYKSGKPVFEKAYGLADREWGIRNTITTKFRIASISKLFTEVAILKLVEEKRLTLDDKLSDFISDYPRGNEITVNHLLTHRSGIPHLNSFADYDELNKFSYTTAEIIALFKDKPLDFNPGEKYRYSNSGYTLLAYIIETVSGKTYELFLDESLFKPYNLTQTGNDNNEIIISKRAHGYMFDKNGQITNASFVNMDIKKGGGSLYSTAANLQTFVYGLIQNKILKYSVRKLPNFGTSNGEEVFTANGRVQGFCHQITYRPKEDLSIIIMGNNYSNIALPMADDIFKIYRNTPYKIPENLLSKSIKLPVDSLKQYEGVYDFGFGPVGTLKVIDSKLTYAVQGQKYPDDLIPLGNSRFFYIQNWVVLRFKKENADDYYMLDWIMGENAYPAKRKN